MSHARFNWSMAGVVIALVIQSAGLVTWAAKLDQRVKALEERVAGSEKLAETVARIDERTKAMQESVNRLSDTRER